MGRLRNYFLNHYPRTDFHELNQDWMISMLFDMINQVENFVEMNSVKYANPIQWDITHQYEKNTIVVDSITGTAYISSKPVPLGVALPRTEYWSVIFDLGRFITLASQNFANSYEAVLTTTATMPTDKDKWIVWNSILYRAKNDIHVGDMYVVDGNIEKYTVEMFFDELAHLITEETEARIEADNGLHGEIVDESVARENADVTLQDNIDAEATARENVDNGLQDNIDAEATARENADNSLQDNIDAEATARENADNSLQDNIDAEATARENADNALLLRIENSKIINVLDAGARGDGVTDDTLAIQNAINNCITHGTVYLPFTGKPYIITSLYITKPIRIISDYSGYEIDDGATIGTPVLQSTSSSYAIYIQHYGVTIENLSIKTTGSGIRVETNLMPRFTIIKNVAIDCTAPTSDNYGLITVGCFLSVFERITCYHANIGIYVAGCTSSTYTNCWCRECNNGFGTRDMYYSSFIDCACDVIKGYAYSFYRNYNTSLINCGHETNSGELGSGFAAVIISECHACRIEVEFTPDVNTVNEIYVASSNVLITNCLSTATHANGVGILADAGAKINVLNCQLANHTIQIAGVNYNYDGCFFSTSMLP